MMTVQPKTTETMTAFQTPSDEFETACVVRDKCFARDKCYAVSELAQGQQL